MNENVLVSILIPCHNAEKYIEKCLNSCINQSYKEIEIVIIDDGSTDNSRNIIKNISIIDKRIRIYHQKNKGVSFTRNKLIELSYGHYIFFLDADDYIPLNSIENLIKNSENGKMDIVIGRSKNVFAFSPSARIVFPFIPTWLFFKKNNKFSFVKSNMCLMWGYILKKSFFKSLNINFDEKLKYFEDIGLATYIFLKSNHFRQIKQVTYFYNRSNYDTNNMSSFSSDNLRKINDFYFATKQLLEYFESENWNFNKKINRCINGALYPILIGYNILLLKLTKNILIRWIIRDQIFSLIKYYNYDLNLSKTWWKFISYFYIRQSYRNYLKINKLNKVATYKRIKNSNSIYKNCLYISDLQKKKSYNKRKKIIFIDSLDFIKNNWAKINDNSIFFIFKLSSNEEMKKVAHFFKEKKIKIIGFSITKYIDLKKFQQLFKDVILIDFDFRMLSGSEIKEITSVKKNIKENISVSISIKSSDIKYASIRGMKYNYIFMEEENE